MSITTSTMLRSQRHDDITTKTKAGTYQASANVGDCPHQPISVAVYLLDANGKEATSEGASPDRRYRKKHAKSFDASSSTSTPTPSDADVTQHRNDQADENVNKINAHRERGGDRRNRPPKKAVDLDPDPSPEDLRRSTEAWSVLLDGCAAAAAPGGTTSGDDVGSASVLPVHLFTSPLRRAVGTSCALSDSLMIQNDEHDSKSGEVGGVAFPLPLPRGIVGDRDGRIKDAANDDRTATTANFVVLNGLCAPAAAVANVGGASKAISEGLIDCAAAFRVENDGPTDDGVARLPLPDVDEMYLAENDALPRQLRRMDRIKQRIDKPPNTAPDLSPSPMMVDGADADADAEDDGGEKAASCGITRKGRGRSVRFWRENDCEHLPPLSSRSPGGKELASMFAPMTPAADDDAAPSPPDLRDEALPEELNEDRRGKMVSVSVVRGHPERDGFMGAVNRAAYLTARAGNRTCVLVTHFEGIRELASECGYNRRLSVPSDGCAIGKFRAKVALPQSKVLAAAGAHSIKWSFYGVDDGCRDFVPVPIAAATTPAPSAAAAVTPDFPRQPRVQIALSVIGRDGGRDDKELHVLALLAPPLDPSAMGSVTLPNDLLLSESTKKRTLEDVIGTTRSHEARGGGAAASDAESSKKKTIIPLDILHGKRKLAKFIAHLRNEKRVAWGTFAEPGEGPSTLPSTRKRFVVDPNDQPPIPCPPSVLFCTVYDD